MKLKKLLTLLTMALALSVGCAVAACSPAESSSSSSAKPGSSSSSTSTSTTSTPGSSATPDSGNPAGPNEGDNQGQNPDQGNPGGPGEGDNQGDESGDQNPGGDQGGDMGGGEGSNDHAWTLTGTLTFNKNGAVDVCMGTGVVTQSVTVTKAATPNADCTYSYTVATNDSECPFDLDVTIDLKSDKSVSFTAAEAGPLSATTASGTWVEQGDNVVITWA